MAKQDLDYEQSLEGRTCIDSEWRNRDSLTETEDDDRILPRTLERLNGDPAKDISGAGGVVVGGVLKVIFARRDLAGAAREQLRFCNILAFIALMIKDYEAEAEDHQEEVDRVIREGQRVLLIPWVNKRERGGKLECKGDGEESDEAKATRKEEEKKGMQEDLEKGERSRMMMG
ncbi:hypothetical protein LTR86_003219 [Recurvomyces mirabilis]|nr:hypothetical protein LTR86_003219 [Recurvomyces mirabilis]